MGTVSSSKFVQELINKNGYFPDDPRVYQIVKYENVFGRMIYGITWENESEDRKHRYEIETEYVIRPKIIWRADSPEFSSDV